MADNNGDLKEIGGYLTFPIFLLVSTWGLLKTILDVLDRLNTMRNFSLGISKEASGVDRNLRLYIFYSDWVPVYIGLFFAVAIFAAVYFMVPMMIREMSKHSRGQHAVWVHALMAPAFGHFSHLEIACYCLGLLAAFVAVAHLIAGAYDWLKVVNQ